MSGEEFCEKLEMKIKNGQWLIRNATARASSIRLDKLYFQFILKHKTGCRKARGRIRQA